ncbi:restriction endonuclease subunit S [Denitromonas ohlonensis]|uniref:restriction endonuclease subunit S n=1 Tax=Denitromonas ohlonensis TaxID=3078508 RepID=UPI0021B33757|nr:restriction endonuclease subunit S [Denitromonas ohlonensis]
MTEQTANLKPGWKIWRFDQMATNVNVRIDNPSESGMAHYVGLEHLDTDSLKIRRWGSPDDVEATKLMFKKGDIIFGRRRAYQRKLGVAEFDGICSAHAMVLRAKPDVVLPEFLPFFMQSELFMSRAVEISVGSLSPTINWKTMAVQEFALPPMEEQRRTFDLLNAGLGTVDELQAALDVLPILRRSMEMRLLSMESVPRQRVGNIAKFTSGKGIRVSDLPKSPSDTNPVPVFGGNGISGYTDSVMDGTAEPTVVIGRVGQFCGVTSMTAGPCWITDNALYPAKMSRDVHPAFLAICLRASNLNRSKLGEYLPLITQEVVHKIEIPVPPPSDQCAAIKEFAQIEATGTSLMARLSSTRSFLMQVASQVLEGGANGI